MSSTRQKDLAERLAHGHAPSLRPTNAIVSEALQNPALTADLVADLVALLQDPRPIVLIRAASALKKIQATEPAALIPFAKKILRAALTCEELRARWNLTVVLGDLPCKGNDRALATELLFDALASESPFLRTFALQGLANYAETDRSLQARIQPIIADFIANGTAAMRARAKKIAASRRSHW